MQVEPQFTCLAEVAVLCAMRFSIYNSFPRVIVYDRKRDARTFAGGMPVVCHPPCRAWSAFLAHQAKTPPGEAELGPLCVEWLKKCGGVLEHPAHSRLFAHCGLPLPGMAANGLWTIEVLQAWWGDARSKRTWLCFAGVSRKDVYLPFALHLPDGDRRRWALISRPQRAATPPAMAQWLIDVARAARVNRECVDLSAAEQG